MQKIYPSKTLTQSRKFTLTGLFLFLTTLQLGAQTELISESSSFGANTSTLDTATGLKWLDVSLSTPFSYDQILVQLGLGGVFEGFRLATQMEVLTLWQNAGINTGPGFLGQFTNENFQPIVELMVLVSVTGPNTGDLGGGNFFDFTTGHIDSGPGGGGFVTTANLSADPDPTITARPSFGDVLSNMAFNQHGSWLVAIVTNANDDSATVIEGGPVSVLDDGATSLLANDTAVDFDTLTVTTTPVSGPIHGTLTLAADGTFTYTHDGSVSATDSFVYEISDGTATDTATVFITITQVIEGIVFQESFETDGLGTRYTVENGSDDGANDYFARRQEFSVGTETSGGTLDGDWFWTGQDIDADGDGTGVGTGESPLASDEGRITFNAFSIFELGRLELTMAAAQGVDQTEFDNGLFIEVKIDDGEFETIGGFRGTFINSPARYFQGDENTLPDHNVEPRLTSTFMEFSWEIPGSGDTMQVRIKMNLNGGLEELAFDNLRVTGDDAAAFFTLSIDNPVVSETAGAGAATVTVTLDNAAPAGGREPRHQPRHQPGIPARGWWSGYRDSRSRDGGDCERRDGGYVFG